MTYSTLSRIVLTSIPPTDISGAFSSFELVIDHAGYRSAFCLSTLLFLLRSHVRSPFDEGRREGKSSQPHQDQ